MTSAGAREWLWPTGHTYIGDGSEPAAWDPVGAFWWRFAGETGWRPVEARLTRRPPPPELKHHVCVWSVPAVRAGLHLPDGYEIRRET